MIQRAGTLAALGLLVALAPALAGAAVWSVEADCEDGDWEVALELAGFGSADASCLEGRKTRLRIDVGDVEVSGLLVTAASSLGTVCELPADPDAKVVLHCGSQTEDETGAELEDEIEVELELEEDETEGEEEPEHE